MPSAAARATSRKRSVRSLPLRLVKPTSPPATRTIARKPSHFGSNTQPSPVGRRRSTSRASAGSASSARPLGVLAKQQPVLLVAVELRRDERPHALEALPLQLDREPPVPLLLEQLVRAAIPDLDRPRAVLAGGDDAFEVAVLERVVLDVHGEVPLTLAEGNPLRHRPARERAVRARGESRSADAGPRGAGSRTGRAGRHAARSRRTARASSRAAACAGTRRGSPVDCRPKRNTIFTERLHLALSPCSGTIREPGISLWKVGKTPCLGYTGASTPITRYFARR